MDNAMTISVGRDFTPNCRYGHGPLGHIVLESISDAPRGLVLPTTLQTMGNEPLMLDGRGFTFTLYRCSTCGYLELFDDGVADE